jgi:hypothetical protein
VPKKTPPKKKRRQQAHRRLPRQWAQSRMLPEKTGHPKEEGILSPTAQGPRQQRPDGMKAVLRQIRRGLSRSNTSNSLGRARFRRSPSVCPLGEARTSRCGMSGARPTTGASETAHSMPILGVSVSRLRQERRKSLANLAPGPLDHRLLRRARQLLPLPQLARRSLQQQYHRRLLAKRRRFSLRRHQLAALLVLHGVLG